jgi:hypothetical protein
LFRNRSRSLIDYETSENRFDHVPSSAQQNGKNTLNIN